MTSLPSLPCASANYGSAVKCSRARHSTRKTFGILVSPALWCALPDLRALCDLPALGQRVTSAVTFCCQHVTVKPASHPKATIAHYGFEGSCHLLALLLLRGFGHLTRRIKGRVARAPRGLPTSPTWHLSSKMEPRTLRGGSTDPTWLLSSPRPRHSSFCRLISGGAVRRGPYFQLGLAMSRLLTYRRLRVTGHP